MTLRDPEAREISASSALLYEEKQCLIVLFCKKILKWEEVPAVLQVCVRTSKERGLEPQAETTSHLAAVVLR